MAKSSRLRLTDLRAVVRLVNECRDRGDDPGAWRVHLAAELVRLAGGGLANVDESADAFSPRMRSLGVVAWGWENGFARPPWERIIAEFLARGPTFCPMHLAYAAAFARTPGACLSQPDVLADDNWYRSDYFDLHRQVGCDVMLYSYQPLAAPGEMANVVLVRAAGEPDFTPRQKALVRETHAAVAGLVGGPLARFADPSPSDLAPRPQQVLRCLLEGDSDKQIAARLGVTMHTVNQHVKRVFRHFGVGSRAELLARWVRRGWGNGFAWAEPD